MPFEVRGLCPLLQVYDMPTSMRFYCEVLGFEIVQRSQPGEEHFDWVWLRWNDADLMLNTAYEQDSRPEQREPARVGSHGDTCLYFGCPDVDAAYAALKKKLPELKPPKVAWYGMKQMYLHDPDGYSICFQWSSSEAKA